MGESLTRSFTVTRDAGSLRPVRRAPNAWMARPGAERATRPSRAGARELAKHCRPVLLDRPAVLRDAPGMRRRRVGRHVAAVVPPCSSTRHGPPPARPTSLKMPCARRDLSTSRTPRAESSATSATDAACENHTTVLPAYYARGRPVRASVVVATTRASTAGRARPRAGTGSAARWSGWSPARARPQQAPPPAQSAARRGARMAARSECLGGRATRSARAA